MLVPTGMCICAEGDHESPSEEHEPGCPKVRNLDLPTGSLNYSGDMTPGGILAHTDMSPPASPLRAVDAVGHGPPRGRPIYLTLGALLI